MLQQTRIEAVKPKFLLFKQTLPTIQDLANCEDDALMRLWEGLGYYSRARNLKKCAITLVEHYNAQLPEEYKALLKLPGIGPYTAGAISSIAYGLPAAAVDGNVMRVLARYFEITEDIRNETLKKEIEKTILECFQEDSTPSFVSNLNQGIMELCAGRFAFSRRDSGRECTSCREYYDIVLSNPQSQSVSIKFILQKRTKR